MSKFGELINTQVPVLINFFTEDDKPSQIIDEVIREVATVLGDKARIIKIDAEKNKELTDALRVKGLPTLILYKEGQMVWRQNGEITKDDLLKEFQPYF